MHIHSICVTGLTNIQNNEKVQGTQSRSMKGNCRFTRAGEGLSEPFLNTCHHIYMHDEHMQTSDHTNPKSCVFRNTILDLMCVHVPTYKWKGEQQGNSVGCKAGIICFRTGVKCSWQPSFQHARWHAKLMLQECVWTAHSIQGSHLTEQPTSVNSPRVPFQFPVLCFCISIL